MPKSKKRLPPVIKAWPIVGGLIHFLKGPIMMLRKEYPKLGSVFTLNLLNITFFIGLEISAHFFKAPETNLSQQWYLIFLGKMMKSSNREHQR
ncbi:hypothetical protein R3W88_014875 [Solanum pinnatisectum]|uniref:Uncharacterized protein n=1 Tax=Solanum pinnatisectum TaxID=50273 RepID=A0AAV9KU41_9SOLN|nr:hypothetical protein R3W88_014875 [Solanum pinnatisectum]